MKKLFTLACLLATICEGILNCTMEPTSGPNGNLPFIVDKFGVKINYGDSQKR